MRTLRLGLLGLLASLVLPSLASAQSYVNYWNCVATDITKWCPTNLLYPMPIQGAISSAPYNYTPLAPAQHGVALSVSTPLLPPLGATYATVCASGQQVNYSTDGQTVPTSGGGQPLGAGQCVGLSGAQVLSNFRAIQKTSTATLDVEYFK